MAKKETTETPIELKWIDNLTGLLDDSFRVPILGIRFGLDPIIGLIPGIGEAISFSISALMVLSMVRHGAGVRLALRMIWNLLVDAIIGVIPVVGDLFDFAQKANRRNFELMKRKHAEGKLTKGGILDVLIVLFILVALLIGLLFLMWKITDYFSAWVASFIS